MALQTTARLRYVSIPPRKMRLVANLVKGLPIQKALDILNFTKRVAAMPIAKTLKSAAANALSQEGTAHLKPEDLMVKNIFVDPAPSAKRIRFQSMGRVFRYRKRFCHLTVILEEKAAPRVGNAPQGKDKTKAEGATEETKAAPKKKIAAAKKAAKKLPKSRPKRPQARSRLKRAPKSSELIRRHVWDRKPIQSVCASASSGTGTASGTPRIAISLTWCTKTC